jgi:DNA-binding response OmpR family regulator
MKILLLEDEASYQETIKEYLESLGYEVSAFEDGDCALEAIFEAKYDLLLLDIRVPNLDGYEILKIVKEEKIKTPVIFITSLTDINNLSIGYELGCNDYIRKPFSLRELKYRVEEVIERFYYKNEDDIICLSGDFCFDKKKELLYRDSKLIELGKFEKRLVALLVQNRGSFIDNSTIREYVWEGKDIDDSDIRMCIKSIRTKTEKTLIENRRGIGYKIERA